MQTKVLAGQCFVCDGPQRISAAPALGQIDMAAEVTVWETALLSARSGRTNGLNSAHYIYLANHRHLLVSSQTDPVLKSPR
jgi:hypothetical protein